VSILFQSLGYPLEGVSVKVVHVITIEIQLHISCSARWWPMDGLHQQPCSHQRATHEGHSRGFCHHFLLYDSGQGYDEMDDTFKTRTR
jgi:hypothetical protein